MFAFKKKKFLLNERTKDLASETERKGLTLFLELLIEEENYELATLVKLRLDCIEHDTNSIN